jgi:hypothetical protein
MAAASSRTYVRRRAGQNGLSIRAASIAPARTGRVGGQCPVLGKRGSQVEGGGGGLESGGGAQSRWRHGRQEAMNQSGVAGRIRCGPRVWLGQHGALLGSPRSEVAALGVLGSDRRRARESGRGTAEGCGDRHGRVGGGLMGADGRDGVVEEGLADRGGISCVRGTGPRSTSAACGGRSDWRRRLDAGSHSVRAY